MGLKLTHVNVCHWQRLEFFVLIYHVVGGAKVRVQYLDTGGYDSFPELVHCYVKLAQAFIIVMNDSSAKSSDCAKRIVHDIEKTRGNQLTSNSSWSSHWYALPFDLTR